MIDIICQVKNGLSPNSQEDQDAIKSEYKQNQLVRCRITKIAEAAHPSIEQNNTLHACFQLVADHADNETPFHMRTKQGVKDSCKIGIDFRDPNYLVVRPDGGVQLKYRSFAFDKLKGLEREKVMQLAFEWCAGCLGLTVDDMIEEAQKKMKRR